MTLPGPGDPETWGPHTSHPNDPRQEATIECWDCSTPLNGEVLDRYLDIEASAHNMVCPKCHVNRHGSDSIYYVDNEYTP